MLKQQAVTKSKKDEAITKAKPSTAVTKAHTVTKAKTFTAFTKARAVTKAQNLINRPLQKLESPISGRNPRKYKNLQRSHVFLQQCYVFRGIHEYIAHTYFG
jgi:hypothetical protein